MSIAIAEAYVTVDAIIEARIVDVWEGLGYAATQISWGNATINRAAGFSMRARIRPGRSEPFTFGDGVKLSSKTGIISLQFFGPKNAGEGRLKEIAQTFAASFQRQQSGELQFEGVDGPADADEGALAGQRLTVDYFYWEATS